MTTASGYPSMSLSNPLYTALDPQDQSSLLIITHFIHVHHEYLRLSAHDLLTPVEESILSRCGKAYSHLLQALPNSSTAIQSLHEGVEQLAASGRLREACVHDDGIHASSRPASVYDSRGVKYTWIRGKQGVSTRFLAGNVLLQHPLAYAETLRKRGGRKDVFVSGWISSRFESAERKAALVREEHEKELQRIRRAEEMLRARKMDKERRMRRLCDTLGDVVSGGRRRRVVAYEECGSGESGESGSEGDEGDEGDDGDDASYCEDADGDDDGDDDGDSGESECDAERLVIGRVRVVVSEREKRAMRRAQRFEPCKKLRRSERLRRATFGKQYCGVNEESSLRGI